MKWLQLAIDSTNEEYSEYEKVLYILNELDKY